MQTSARLLSLLLSLSLYAQAPYLVKDINTTMSGQVESSTPYFFTENGGRTYFLADLRTSGKQLWSTDGTAAGTTMVAAILPGGPGIEATWLSAVGGSILFNARDVNYGVELWTSDGTAAGTRMLLDLNPGPNSGRPSRPIAFGDRWLFAADDGVHGRELWSTDGTAAGTRMVRDIVAGSAASNPTSFALLGGTMYFLAGGPEAGIWKTDGTESGTVPVVSMAARNLTVAGTRLFLEGATAETMWELWVSDGTAAGTSMLPEIRPGWESGFPPQYSSLPPTPVGDRVIFLADDGVHGRELWISDGTAAGTHMIRDLTPGAESQWGYLFARVFGGRAYFAAFDGEHGSELWVTDGTEAGTTLFAEFTPGTGGSFVQPLYVLGGKLFFTANSSLGITDGTEQGTRFLRTPSGAAVRYAQTAGVAGGQFYFAGHTQLTGAEPWVSDGTDAGTRMIANIAPDGPPSSLPRSLTATSDLLFFHASEGLPSPNSYLNETSLWRTDGTEAGTFKLRETGQHPSDLTGAGPYVFFTDTDNGRTPMISDGTLAGTKPATDFLRRFGDESVMQLFPFGDTLFAAVGDQFSTTLWKTTAAPSAPAVRLGGERPSSLTDVAGQYMYYAEAPSGMYKRALWITDGTPAGTRAVVPDFGDTNLLSDLVSAQGAAFFLKVARDQSMMLWRSDGTFDGTTVVKELPEVARVIEIDSTGRRIFFLSGTALWTSDGTAAGTIELVKTTPMYPGGSTERMQAVGDRVVFLQEIGANTHELWTSDGTVAGTRALRQVPPNVLVAIDGLAYFRGTDEVHGVEVWVSDGTSEGTKLFHDINPGPASSSPLSFTKVRDTLYFHAFNDSTGAELWAVPLTEARLSVSDARAGESAAAVRFTLTLADAPSQTVAVSYTTSDGTARAGEDYEARSGTVTFAPGETTKTIDVRILGDPSPENNETFAVTFHDVQGARLLRSTAYGVVDDDDQVADLGVEAVFLESSTRLAEVVRVSNHGPRAAVTVPITVTSLPAVTHDCTECLVVQIPAGGSEDMHVQSSVSGQQVYRSAIVAGRDPDPNTSNDAASWTITDFEDLAMNAAFLTPGRTATVSAAIISHLPVPFPISGDTSIFSISSDVTTEDGVAKFTITAHKPGTTYLTVGGQRRNLTVTVVPEGTMPRWPDGLAVQPNYSAVDVGEPLILTVTPAGTAPLTAATATGLVTVTANGRELARRHVSGTAPVEIPVYLTTLGSVSYQLSYAGDAHFLPQTFDSSVYVWKGLAVMTGSLERDGTEPGTYRLHVRLTGAPGASPTGSLQVSHNGASQGTFPVTPSSDGTSIVEGTLTGLTGSDVFVHVTYSGDSLYKSSSQEIRFFARRRRTVRH